MTLQERKKAEISTLMGKLKGNVGVESEKESKVREKSSSCKQCFLFLRLAHHPPLWEYVRWRTAAVSHCSNWCRTVQSCCAQSILRGSKNGRYISIKTLTNKCKADINYRNGEMSFSNKMPGEEWVYASH